MRCRIEFRCHITNKRRKTAFCVTLVFLYTVSFLAISGQYEKRRSIGKSENTEIRNGNKVKRFF